MMIQAGIARVVAPVNTNTSWEDRLIISRGLFNEANVFITELDKVD